MNPDFPEQTLSANMRAVERRIVEIAGDMDDVSAEDIHHWQDKNPVICEALVQLMLGGSTNIYHGGLLHLPLRYFTDKRPGLPRDVGALVKHRGADSVIVAFHNTGKEAASFIIQGGCFGEHEIASAKALGLNAAGGGANASAGGANVSTGGSGAVPVGGKYLRVELGPDEGIELDLAMRRFTQKPGYAMPGMDNGIIPPPIINRFSV